MAIKFGNATTDYMDVNLSGSTNFSNNACRLFMGWFYPTTLTAGKCYFTPSVNSPGLSVDASTNEIQITIPRATTNRTYSTSGAGIQVNVWHFIAFFYSSITDGAGTPIVWVGLSSLPPREIPLNFTVTGVGAAAGVTRMAIGNTATPASNSFQGEIGPFCVYIDDVNNSNINALGLQPVDVLGGSDRSRLLTKYILPFYRGNAPVRGLPGSSSGGSNDRLTNGFVFYLTGNQDDVPNMRAFGQTRNTGQVLSNAMILSHGTTKGGGNPRNVRSSDVGSRSLVSEVL